jgi:ADP-dependent phosphofructokinase/glucokinase
MNIVSRFTFQGCAILYESLLHADTEQLVIAFQAAFDVLELGNQGFCADILQHLHQRPVIANLFPTPEEKQERAKLFVVSPVINAQGENGDANVSQKIDLDLAIFILL